MCQTDSFKKLQLYSKTSEWAKTFAIKYCSNTASTYIFMAIFVTLAQRTSEQEYKFVKIKNILQIFYLVIRKNPLL